MLNKELSFEYGYKLIWDAHVFLTEIVDVNEPSLFSRLQNMNRIEKNTH